MKRSLNLIVAIVWLAGIVSALTLYCIGLNMIFHLIDKSGLWLISSKIEVVFILSLLILPLLSKQLREKGPRCVGRLIGLGD